jgi:hypothetical protein
LSGRSLRALLVVSSTPYSFLRKNRNPIVCSAGEIRWLFFLFCWSRIPSRSLCFRIHSPLFFAICSIRAITSPLRGLSASHQNRGGVVDFCARAPFGKRWNKCARVVARYGNTASKTDIASHIFRDTGTMFLFHSRNGLARNFW